MNEIDLSEEQKKVFNYDGNVVVIANPGSGKTFIVCEKIKFIINKLLDYQGVIAISYTNKASKELKDRLKNVNLKSSFFNTLDTFLLMEIIYPFGQHVFGNAKEEFQIYDNKDKSSNEVNEFRSKSTIYSYEGKYIKLGELYLNGKIMLEYISELAVYIINRSKACKNYLKARYKYIFIDEYQDCGEGQHNIFLKIVSLGIIGVAVGDPNQSIYGFSGKSSKYLLQLKENSNFEIFYLTRNYRCHKSIIEYSSRLLDKDTLMECDDKRIFYKKVNGNQIDICKYIDSEIDKIKSLFSIKNYNDIAILVRGDVTGKIVNNNLNTEHRYFQTTELDKDSSLWSGLFKRLLRYKMNSGNKYAFVEEFFYEDDDKFKILYNELREFDEIDIKKEDCKTNFIRIAELIYPHGKNDKAIRLLEEILKDDNLYNSYKEADKNQVQIMTLHKSKGLEFRIVIHLDMYRFILPNEKKENGIWKIIGFNQALNLHYVGITRAIDACFIITSTKRINGSNSELSAEDSILLSYHNVKELRKLYS